MELNELKYTKGSRKDKKRVGRGDKTAGRGENGQKSRTGYSRKIGFEGGQNPLYLRIPKRGFNNFNKKFYTIVNLADINDINESKITPDILIKHNLIRKNYGLLKILGNGEFNSKIIKEVSAHKFSKSVESKLKIGKVKITSLT